MRAQDGPGLWVVEQRTNLVSSPLLLSRLTNQEWKNGVASGLTLPRYTMSLSTNARANIEVKAYFSFSLSRKKSSILSIQECFFSFLARYKMGLIKPINYLKCIFNSFLESRMEKTET
jgi:hypothetical protein